MITILSPAKNMRAAMREDVALTAPRFLPQTRALHRTLAACPPYELESLLKVSPPLALRACADFAAWRDAGGSAAAFAFYGLAYQHLDAQTLSADALTFGQQHLRILSAFYGPLRPLDAILPYRLELAHKLRGKPLYQCWGDAFYRDVYGCDDTVINLASGEYSRAVRPFLQEGDHFITCEFLQYHKGKLRCLPTMAKMARGSMARFILENGIDSPEQLPGFNFHGFTYEQSLSDNATMVFITRQ